MLELRDYQKQAIEEIEAAIAFGSTHIVLDAPVAYGKSIVIAELCNTFSDSNIVILLNIEALIDQIAEALQQQEAARIREKTEKVNQQARLEASRYRFETDQKIQELEHQLQIKQLELKKEEQQREAELARYQVVDVNALVYGDEESGESYDDDLQALLAHNDSAWQQGLYYLYIEPEKRRP